MKVKDKIQLANITKIFIEYFDKSMNQLEYNELILIFINNGNKVE